MILVNMYMPVTINFKNTSTEKYGGLGRSKSTMFVLPGDIHTWPKGTEYRLQMITFISFLFSEKKNQN